MARAYVGTSGWSYDDWRNDVFYPTGLPSSKWLGFLAERFDTVELNASFYRWPRPSSVHTWGQTGPDTFRFAIKLWRGFTHYRRLGDRGDDSIARFVALFDAIPAPKRGPLLLQLPPQMDVDVPRLERFLDDLQAAAGGWRIAVETRNATWLEPGVVHALDERKMALVVHDMRNAAPVNVPNDGADFVYVRRHGPGRRYSGSYPDDAIAVDAAAIRGWVDGGRDVFVYYNNDRQGNAVRNAASLRRALGLPSVAQPAERVNVTTLRKRGPRARRPVRARAVVVDPATLPPPAPAVTAPDEEPPAPRPWPRRLRRAKASPARKPRAVRTGRTTRIGRPRTRAPSATRTTVSTTKRKGGVTVRRTVKVSEPRLQ